MLGSLNDRAAIGNDVADAAGRDLQFGQNGPDETPLKMPNLKPGEITAPGMMIIERMTSRVSPPKTTRHFLDRRRRVANRTAVY